MLDTPSSSQWAPRRNLLLSRSTCSQVVSHFRVDRVSLILCPGLVNPSCVGLIGSGVVVHVPSFFAELDALESQGLFVLGTNLTTHCLQETIQFDRTV